MTRAWPFEGKSEGVDKIRSPQDFLKKLGTEETEAVVIRIGRNDAMLVLVAATGRWERWVYHSMEEALAAGRSLGVTLHEGEYPEELRVRIGKFQPGPEHYDRSAYPEQGEVGPVIPYPENRPRQIPAEIEAPHGASSSAKG
jgi:hypothetical protein